MSDDEAAEESDIRRRAAWLLGMLVLVAALFVTLMVTFFNSSGGDGDQVDNLAGPTQPVGSNTGSSSSRTVSGSASTPNKTRASSPSTKPPRGSTTCPDVKKCALDGDLGAIDAINAYRTQNGKKAVSGSVSEEAKQCAFNNGNGCTGGWAETQVPAADANAAVRKILQFGKLLSDMKSIEVGWAYDPGAKQYYFALIRQS